MNNIRYLLKDSCPHCTATKPEEERVDRIWAAHDENGLPILICGQDPDKPIEIVRNLHLLDCNEFRSQDGTRYRATPQGWTISEEQNTDAATA